MLKASFKNILLYILVKYLFFYVVMMFKINDFRYLQIGDLRNGEDWFLYLWMILFLPVLNMILFSAPIYFLFRLKSVGYFLLAITAIFLAEYFVYVFFTSEKHVDINGVYNGIVSLLVFCLFFFKEIKSKFKRATT